MEDQFEFDVSDDQIELPPGFRFHPTDEELITHYLSQKILDCSFSALAVGQVDLNKVEPWDLPRKAKMGEKEWYFFCLKDRKYPTGLRTNRATDSGYWKATGKDKEIFKDKSLVGMKKTLVFYRGRAPRGEKTNWVMHEYRLDGKNSMFMFPKSSQNEWVISRIFNKSSEGNKSISGIMSRPDNYVPGSPELPLLTEVCNSDENQTGFTDVTCFSGRTEDPGNRFIDDSFTSSSSSFKNVNLFPFLHQENSIFYPLPESVTIQELSLRQIMVGKNMKQNPKPESWENGYEMEFRALEEKEFPDISACQIDLDCLWNY